MTISGSEYSSHEAIQALVDELRKGKLEVKIGGSKVEIGKELGHGGTKTVYDAYIDGKHFALAIPNKVDGANVVYSKWLHVLHEPQATQLARNLGIFCNPYCEIHEAQIDGISFPLLLMTRYQDLPYPLFPNKASRAINVPQTVLPEDLTPDIYEMLLSDLEEDIRIAIEHQISGRYDVVNACLVNGKPRLYLSDLGKGSLSNEKWKERDQEIIRRKVEMYFAIVEGLFQVFLPEAEKEKNKFLEGDLLDSSNPQGIIASAANRITEKILSGRR